MIRIKKYLIFLMSFMNAVAMENPDARTQELYAQTRGFFDAALHDFGIPRDQIEIAIQITEGGELLGQAYPNQKKITFNRGKNIASAEAEFGAYHEVAHCADKKLQGFARITDPAMFSGVFAVSTLALTGAGIKVSDALINKYGLMFHQKSLLYAAGGIFVASSIASFFLSAYATRPFGYTFEYRANKAACKKLLEKNKFNVITQVLTLLKVAQQRGDSRLSWDHPPIEQEFQKMVIAVQKQGYQVSVEEFPEKRKVKVSLLQNEQILSKFSARYRPKK